VHYEDGGGLYYTVNPIAVRQNVDVFTLNRRCKLFVDSPQFGRVCMVCIGATMVGAIEITAQPGTVHKGEELGYFAFGGSTLIVLFPKLSIRFDQDLLLNSSKPIETIVKVVLDGVMYGGGGGGGGGGEVQQSACTCVVVLVCIYT
jgi:phosphatidylserine decarboxylase